MNPFLSIQNHQNIQINISNMNKNEKNPSQPKTFVSAANNGIYGLNSLEMRPKMIKLNSAMNAPNVRKDHLYTNQIPKFPLTKNKIPLKNLLKNKTINQFFQKQKELEKKCSKKLKECKVGVSCRRKFTEKEDNILKNAVNIFGAFNWKIIASLVPGRNPRQCRDRYTNYLAPGLVHLEWSEEEDQILAEKYMAYGPKWTLIRQYIPARSANDIKNRFNYTVSHKIQKYKLKQSENKEVDEDENMEMGNESNSITFNDDFGDIDDFFINLQS